MMRCAAFFGIALLLSQAGADVARETPGPRASHVLVYHAALGRVLMLTGPLPAASETVWSWDGSTWTPLSTGGPPARGQSGAAYDARRARLILHGGSTPAGSMKDTWEWTGSTWEARTARSARERDHHALVYDAHRGRAVLYGGLHRPRPDRASWEWVEHVEEWDGERWASIDARGPGARVSPGMAFDAARGVVVLFGGGDREARSHGDTWTWNGQTWRNAAEGGPPARRAHAMAFDSRMNGVLMFGGTDGTTSFDDLWLWDGIRWSRIPVTGASPGRRFGAGMAYDEARGRLVLYGGFQDGRLMSDTWEWDGRVWEAKP